MNKIKKSKQRDAILNFLVSRKDHPTAKTIYEAVRRTNPHISLGTVYRNLALLEELGHIIRIPCIDDCEHYDSNTAPHYHFVCKCCKCVSDLEMPSLHFAEDLAAYLFDGTITGHQLTFYGLCKNCKEKNIDFSQKND